MSRALHTLTITCQTGDVRFEFIADRPVLDYLSTIAERGTSDDEKLRSEQDLADWIEQSGILDSAPPVTQQTLERGKALREAMFRLIADTHQPPNRERDGPHPRQHCGGGVAAPAAARRRRTAPLRGRRCGLRASRPGLSRPVRQPGPSGPALVRGREVHPRLH